MKCPFCSDGVTKVSQTAKEPSIDGTTVTRRRICLRCKQRFKTIERPNIDIKVQKKGKKETEKFSVDKLEVSLNRVLHKSSAVPGNLSRDIERWLVGKGTKKVSTRAIADEVYRRLGDIDKQRAEVYRLIYLPQDTVENQESTAQGQLDF